MMYEIINVIRNKETMPANLECRNNTAEYWNSLVDSVPQLELKSNKVALLCYRGWDSDD